jgi:hypothetical protein
VVARPRILAGCASLAKAEYLFHAGAGLPPPACRPHLLEALQRLRTQKFGTAIVIGGNPARGHGFQALCNQESGVVGAGQDERGFELSQGGRRASRQLDQPEHAQAFRLTDGVRQIPVSGECALRTDAGQPKVALQKDEQGSLLVRARLFVPAAIGSCERGGIPKCVSASSKKPISRYVIARF